MRPQPHRRRLVVFSSSVDPASRLDAFQYKRVARTGRIRRVIRISMLLTVIVVRPRWRPLLAGIVCTALGAADQQATILIIPGLLFLWYALLTAGDTDADRETRAQLKRELAAYSTPAQRTDLAATLDRYPDGATRELRDILATPVGSDRGGIPGARPY
jgi:hypothetical protein